MQQESPAIKIESISKVYALYHSHRDRLKEALHPFRKKYHRDFYALRDVSFEVKKGETVGIIGRNGSGKSTLLSIIAGVKQPSSGKVEVQGRISSLLELGAGFNPELSGMENIFFYGLIAGFSRQEMDMKLQRILDFADIGDFVYQPVKVYSSGMFIRLAFSCAIHIEPEIMIIDEALSVGDMNFQAKCMTAISKIKESGATVLFVSHDVGSVKSLCDRALYLEQGHPVFFGAADKAADLYVKKMREELTEEAKRFSRVSKEFNDAKGSNTQQAQDQQKDTHKVVPADIEFKYSEEFNQRAELFRYGNGDARITFAELLNKSGDSTLSVDFNEEVTLRVYFESYKDIDLSANFYIQDNKKIPLFGGGPKLFGSDLIPCKAGHKYLSTYTFRTPLTAGNFAIQLQLTAPIVPDETAKFLDVVENALVFKVNRRAGAKVWAKLYLPVQYDLMTFAGESTEHENSVEEEGAQKNR